MIAATLPMVIVIMAITPSANVQSKFSAAAPIITILSAAANPAFFVPAASKAVMVGGEPS